MRLIWYFISFSLVLVFSSCGGNGGLDYLEISPDEVVIPGVVTFQMKDGIYNEQNLSYRKWKVFDNIVPIDADITGDGKIEHFSINIQQSDEENLPRLVKDKYDENYILLVSEEIDHLKLADADKDFDADIIISNNDNDYLVENIGIYKKFSPMSENDFKRQLSQASGYMLNGDIVNAYNEAFKVFLGMPYSWDVSGEGKFGRFDRDQIVDLEKSNCVTFVENVLAMVRSDGNYNDFIKHLRKIRYKDGVREYPMRNHFQSSDWIPNNIKAWYIRDINYKFMDNPSKVMATINKQNWYHLKTALEGDFSGLKEEDIVERILELQGLGEDEPSVNISLSYIPFDRMIVYEDDHYSLNPEFINALPVITIFNIVNENFSINDSSGNYATDLIVTHTGFIFKKSANEVVVYHSTNKSDTGLDIMTEETLLSFLIHRYIGSESLKAVGLHLSKPHTSYSAMKIMSSMIK